MSEPDRRVLTVETSSTDDGIDFVVLAGELDFSSGEPLSAALAELADGPRRVVVDLGGLAFVDSSGVKMLVAAARAVEDAGGAFVLAAPNRTVLRVFDILHLPDVVTVLGDTETALRRVASSRAGAEGGG